MPLPLEFRLERYQGPLDLLLDLIRKQQIDIADIPIAKIHANPAQPRKRFDESALAALADSIREVASCSR